MPIANVVVYFEHSAALLSRIRLDAVVRSELRQQRQGGHGRPHGDARRKVIEPRLHTQQSALSSRMCRRMVSGVVFGRTSSDKKSPDSSSVTQSSESRSAEPAEMSSDTQRPI